MRAVADGLTNADLRRHLERLEAKARADHLHCAAGCEKAAGEAGDDGVIRCVKCGAIFAPCTPETCGSP